MRGAVVYLLPIARLFRPFLSIPRPFTLRLVVFSGLLTILIQVDHFRGQIGGIDISTGGLFFLLLQILLQQVRKEVIFSQRLFLQNCGSLKCTCEEPSQESNKIVYN